MNTTPDAEYNVAKEYAALCKRQDAAQLLDDVLHVLEPRLTDLCIFTRRLPQADAAECRDIFQEIREGLERIRDKYTKA